jgi:hypothetical protein
LLVDAAHTWLLLSHAVLPGSDYISDFEKKQSLQRKLVGCVEWCAHFVNLEIFPKRKFLNPEKPFKFVVYYHHSKWIKSNAKSILCYPISHLCFKITQLMFIL